MLGGSFEVRAIALVMFANSSNTAAIAASWSGSYQSGESAAVGRLERWSERSEGAPALFPGDAFGLGDGLVPFGCDSRKWRTFIKLHEHTRRHGETIPERIWVT
jgi:hypothetical protein